MSETACAIIPECGLSGVPELAAQSRARDKDRIDAEKKSLLPTLLRFAFSISELWPEVGDGVTW